MRGFPRRVPAMTIVLVGGALTLLGGEWPSQSASSANAAEESQSRGLPGRGARAPTLYNSASADGSDANATVLLWLSRVRWWRLPPGRPGTPAVVAASTDTLTVTWRAPESVAFDIVGYDVQYRASGSDALLERKGDGAGTRALIDGLAEATTYELRVRAVTELGSGDWSATATATTLDGTPRFAEGETATREIAENTSGEQAIGAPLVATAAGRPLRYALGGPDGTAFALDSEIGQLRTREGVAYDHESQPQRELTVTAEGPLGRTASIAVTVQVTDIDEPPGAPGIPRTEFASPTRLALSWTAPENSGPPIEDYDLEYRAFGEAIADAGHEGPETMAELAGLSRDTRYTFRVRASNAEGVGPWSQEGSGRTTRRGTEGVDPSAPNEPPRVSSTRLPSGATATAGGRVETFRVQGAFEDPAGEILYLEASSRNRSIASASLEGGVVAVRPHRVGQATIAVTASDSHDDTVVGTFDIDVQTPSVPDPDATLDQAGDTLTLTFTEFFEPDERRAYEVAVRQKAPRGGWSTSCFDTHNSGTSAGDLRVSAEFGVESLLEPGNAYEVVYRRAGHFCVAARPTGVWSRVAEVIAPGAVAFDIDVVFVGDASATHRTAIQTAAAEWREIVQASLADVDFSTQPVPADQCLSGQPEITDTVDDLRVYVSLRSIDGVGGTLATARTCVYRLASGLPVLSAITLDTDDLEARSSRQTERTAMHEIAHALGFGTRWYDHSLVRHPSLDADGDPVIPTPDTHFTGALAIAAFDAAGGTAYRDPIPVENTGGAGSQDGHWRESVFGSELLSPSVAPGQIQPLSAITIQALADMGYRVDVSRAEAYSLPALSAVFAPPESDVGPASPGNCVVVPGGTAVDDDRRTVLRSDAVTVHPARLR